MPIVCGRRVSAEDELKFLKASETAASAQVPEDGAAIPIIIITEDRYRANPTLYLKRLNAVLGEFRSVFARNCDIRRITPAEARPFLNAHHSLGFCSAGVFYGVFSRRTTGAAESAMQPGELLAVASFSKPRHWIKEGRDYNSYEFVRYASLPDVRISGGMGKVLEKFIKDHPDADDVMSYCDLEWSDGAAYRSLGFVEEGVTEPMTFAIDTSSWQRVRKVVPLATSEGAVSAGALTTYTNLGSKKFRYTI